MTTRPGAEAALLERWRENEEVEDDDEYRMRKQSWFQDASVFLTGLPKSSHIWCHHKDVARPLLEPFHNYLKSAPGNAIYEIWRRMSSEMGHCINCVVEYRRVKELYRSEYNEAVVSPIMAILDYLDKDRIASHLRELAKGAEDSNSQEVICVLFEVLMYPELLEAQVVNSAFVPFLLEVSRTHDLHFSKERYPGLYALLFHQNSEIRRIALQFVNTLGPIEAAEDLESLHPFLQKRLRSLETGRELADGTTLESLWIGLKTLLGLLKGPALEDGILEDYPALTSVVLNNVSESSDVFWHALCCLKILLEVLGYKLWLKIAFSPGVLRNTLLSQCFHTKHDNIHKAIFDVFTPFLQSLEVVEDGQYEKQRRYLLYFFLLQVPNSSNFSSLAKKTASQAAFSLVTRGYRMHPPMIPFECAHFWGPPLVSTYKDSGLHPSVRKPACQLVEVLLVADAVILSGLYSNRESSFICEEEGLEDASWQGFSYRAGQTVEKWFCFPVIWIEVLKEAVISPSFTKAFVWAVSRLFVFDLDLSGDDYPEAIRKSLIWDTPKGCDDGADGKTCSNTLRADIHLMDLIAVLKRAANTFANTNYDEVVRNWTWDPTCAEVVLLLLVDSSQLLRKLGRHIIQSFANSNNTNLDAAIQCILENTQASLSFIRGFRYAVKMLIVEPVKFPFSLQQLLFIASKVFDLARRLDAEGGPWEEALCTKLSCVLWPLVLKVLDEGRSSSGSEMWCMRLLEVLPSVFKHLTRNGGQKIVNAWETHANDCPRWFQDVVDWGRTTSATILRRWKDAIVSILEDLARGPLCSIARCSKAVESLLRPGSRLDDDERARMQLLFSSTSLDKLGGSSHASVLPRKDVKQAEIFSSGGQIESDEDIDLSILKPRKEKMQVDNRQAENKHEEQKAAPKHKRPTRVRIVSTTKASLKRPKEVGAPSKVSNEARASMTLSSQVEASPKLLKHKEHQVNIQAAIVEEPMDQQTIDDLVREDGLDSLDAALDPVKRQRLAPPAVVSRRKLVQIEMPGEHRKTTALTRAKARPQRLVPRPDEWLKRILHLDIFSLDKVMEPLQVVPTSFTDAEHYVEIFRPHLLEEFKAQLERACQEVDRTKNMTVGVVKLMSLDRIDELYRARFTSGRGEDTAARACLENDLLLLSKQPYPFSSDKEHVHVLGKVDRRELNRTEGVILLVKLYLPATSERLQKAKSLLVERTSWHITRLTNITPQLREFQAMSALAASPLADIIVDPAIRNVGAPPRLETANLPEEFCSKLREDYNPSQVSAIEASLGSQGSNSSHISLVQGPPGTGKTRTIVAIISALLQTVRKNDEQESFDPSRRKKPSPRLSSKVAIARSWQDAALAKQIQEEEPKRARRRVLVCAQSNAAVDELVTRICEKGLYDSKGNFYKPNVVRVGNANAVHEKSKHCFIETLIESKLASEKAGEDSDWQAEINALKAKLEKTTGSIRDLEMRLSQCAEDKEEEAAHLRAELGKHRDSRRQIMGQLQHAGTQLRVAYEGNKDRRKAVKNRIIRDAEVVLSTLSGSGGDVYAACIEPSSQKLPSCYFDALVMDEAAQALEPATLVPLQLLADEGGKCIMIGDPKQLPATVLSQKASKMCFQRSMFERLQVIGFPVNMLKVQYRMHPEIRQFPSRHFYDDGLLDGGSLRDERRAPFHKDRFFGPYMFFDVVEGQECGEDALQSISNVEEANFVMELFKSFTARYRREIKPGRFGIITPYKRQQNHLRDKFLRQFPDLSSSVEFNTVDGFQGREVDILIFSTVRTNSRIGFVADVRRMNVALTRARFSLWIVGNSQALKSDAAWSALLKDASDRKLLTAVYKPYNKLCSGVDSPVPASRKQAADAASTVARKRNLEVLEGPASRKALKTSGLQKPSTPAARNQESGKAVEELHQLGSRKRDEKQQQAGWKRGPDEVRSQPQQNEAARAGAGLGAGAGTANRNVSARHDRQQAEETARAGRATRPAAAAAATGACVGNRGDPRNRSEQQAGAAAAGGNNLSDRNINRSRNNNDDNNNDESRNNSDVNNNNNSNNNNNNGKSKVSRSRVDRDRESSGNQKPRDLDAERRNKRAEAMALLGSSLLSSKKPERRPSDKKRS